MPAQDILAQAVVAPGAKLPVAAFLSITGPYHAPYLVVTALDRGDYQAGNPGTVGRFLGNGAALPLAAETGDIRGAGIVFTWQAGQYVNSIYGSLSGLSYVSSAAPGDVTSLSVFTTPNLAMATQNAGNPLAMLRADEAGYGGSTTVLTSTAPAAPASQATPASLAACALSYVGMAWNDHGCWNLASTITATSGAGLPLPATALGVPGHGGGEWVVVFNGPLHSDPGWQSLVVPGDAIAFGTPGGGGHITLCVAGAGATAMLLDNITFQNAQGQIANAAHDGAPTDILIAPPHPASQEWAGVQSNSVVIYALDTPAIADRVAMAALALNSTTSLSSLVSISDPAGRAIAKIQAYEVGPNACLCLNGQAVAANSAGTAATATSLAALSVAADTTAGACLIEIRAFNGNYWGDWQAVPLQIGPAATGQISLGDWLPAAASLSPAPSFAAARPVHHIMWPADPSPVLAVQFRH